MGKVKPQKYGTGYFCLRMRHTFILLLLQISITVVGLAGPGYHVQIDLTSLRHDRLAVTIDVPPVAIDTAVFVFPVTVPGTYEPHLWWRLVHNFAAFDAQGSPLPVTRSADSQFVIGQASRLHRVRYDLDDSFDDEDDRVTIFHPTGTSFQGDSVFVFNHGGIVGYIEGYQRLPYLVSVQRPERLYCSTALPVTSRSTDRDTYMAGSYDELVDGPAVFARPDTASFQVNGVNVQVALIHPRDTLIAPAYAKTLEKVTSAIGAFLPSMPVDRYAFLIYLWDGDTVEVKGARMGQGALEHSYSSLYFWRYTSKPFGLESVAAHEFLHILLPLNVHSREIDEFNFRSPQMSAHLWLYEGVTEYFAHQALLRGKASSESRFIREVKQQARSLNVLPDTFSLYTFSRNVLTAENQELYPVIYEIGPLNALLMDIQLREESNGQRGLLELVYQLMERYGPAHPFNDDELFDVIEGMTSPAFGAYCRTYIRDRTLLPLNEYLPRIGLTYTDSTLADRLTFGVAFSGEMKDLSNVIIEPTKPNPLGVQAGDRLVAIDGKELSSHSPTGLRKLFNPEKDQSISLSVERNGDVLELSGTAVTTQRVVRHVIGEVDSPTAEQVRLRNLVFYGNSGGASGQTSRPADH